METTVLRTKLKIPSPRPEHVYRSRLTEMLETGLYGENGFARKFTLISAPAGYGKTNLLAEWLYRGGKNTAWVSLDKRDSDPAHFWRSVVQSLQEVEQDIGKPLLGYLQGDDLHTDHDSAIKNLLDQLLNEIACLEQNVFLVLDDYHVISASEVHRQTLHFLSNLPQRLHLVISSRVDPPLTLHLLRGRGEVMEIRQSHLCLTVAETAEFLQKITGRNFSEREARELTRRTEGWAAGLQMAAISLKHHADTRRFIKDFTGTNRFILEYLTEEILKSQPREVQLFLLETSVLEYFNASLCHALTGQDDCLSLLEHLERSNLFLVPLDEHRNWYRYHHLFAELLKHQLTNRYRDKVPRLHLLASQWYEKNNLLQSAMEHAFLAGDQERAARLLDFHIDQLWSEGKKRIILDWLQKLPEKFLHHYPKLIFFKANLLLFAGQLPGTKLLLEQGEEILTRREKEGAYDPGGEQMLWGMALVVRATIAWYQGEGDAVIMACSKARELFPREESFWHGTLSALTGDAYAYRGDFTRAHAELSKGLKLGKMAENTELYLKLGGKLATTLWYQGKLKEAERLCREQLSFIEEKDLSEVSRAGFLYLVLGEIMREKNCLDEAEKYIDKGERLGERERFYPLLAWAYTFRIMLLFSRNELDKAGEALDKLEALSRESSMIFYAGHQVFPWRIRLTLARGKENRMELKEALEKLHADPLDLYSYLGEERILAAARVMRALRDYGGAVKLLEGFHEAASENGRKGYQLKALLLLAITRWDQEEREVALNNMEQALHLGEPEDYCRTFLDEGPAAAALLYETRSREILPAYTLKLLEKFNTILEKDQAARKQPELVEPLSERELEILELISRGMSNKEISQKIYLAVNTVKWYTGNIYGKLGVSRRTEAVDKARSLGILP